MQAKELFWQYFQQTGSIGPYLLSKRMEEEYDGYYGEELSEEERGNSE